MKAISPTLGHLLAVLVVSAAGSGVRAETFDLSPVDQGSFSRSLTGFGFGLNESISHQASDMTVTIMNGNTTSGPPVFSQNSLLSAGYLIFAVPAIGSDLIVSASLDLEWTGDSFPYQVNRVHSDPALLQIDYSDSGFPLFGTSKTLLNDLIGGPEYASSLTPGADSLGLNAAAIADFNAATGGLVVIGLFGGTGTTFASADLTTATLRLQTVPEPAAFTVVAVMSLAGLRPTRSRRYRPPVRDPNKP